MSIPDPMLRLSTQSQGGKDSLLPYLITFTIGHAPFSCQWHAILMPVTCHFHDSFAPSRSIIIPVSWHSPDSHANSYWLSRAPRSNPGNVKGLSWNCQESGMRMVSDGGWPAGEWRVTGVTGMGLLWDWYVMGMGLVWDFRCHAHRDNVVLSCPVTS